MPRRKDAGADLRERLRPQLAQREQQRQEQRRRLWRRVTHPRVHSDERKASEWGEHSGHRDVPTNAGEMRALEAQRLATAVNKPRLDEGRSRRRSSDVIVALRAPPLTYYLQRTSGECIMCNNQHLRPSDQDITCSGRTYLSFNAPRAASPPKGALAKMHDLSVILGNSRHTQTRTFYNVASSALYSSFDICPTVM